jgi:unsaturated chondroitin disaccharide hydrolase
MSTNPINTPIKASEQQFSLLLQEAEKAHKIPRTLDEKGEIFWASSDFDWTEGFFPGSCWYFYEATNDPKWKKAAEQFQALFENHKKRTDNHDLGFVFNCSYGNAYRLTKDLCIRYLCTEHS